jgi:hypothetical protein
MTETDAYQLYLIAARNLRSFGYATACFVPEELEGVKPRYVEDAMVEHGWIAIDCLKEPEAA